MVRIVRFRPCRFVDPKHPPVQHPGRLGDDTFEVDVLEGSINIHGVKYDLWHFLQGAREIEEYRRRYRDALG